MRLSVTPEEVLVPPGRAESVVNMLRELTSFTYLGPEVRLDRLLRDRLGCGLRLARGLIASGRVRMDGQVVRRKAFIVESGRKITVSGGQVRESKPVGVAVLCVRGMWAAVYKPAGVHSDTGRSKNNVAALLPDLFPGRGATLLNRLDFATSGILLVGLSFEAAKKYICLQNQGLVDKTYAAVVRGRLEGRCTITAYIDQSRRRKVRVKEMLDPDPLRHSEILPVRMPGPDITLVRVRIKKGKRHQIRAHLGALGYPVLGDCLYGPPGEGGRLYLHHEKIVFPEFEAECNPDWEKVFRIRGQ
ncbi:MAG: pseudouridine synthase [Desulfonatronovibrionaceae bacterium]